MEKLKDIEFSPEVNPKAISIIQQEDGNWKGYIQKSNKVIIVRQYDPTIVLQMLLTHTGEI